MARAPARVVRPRPGKWLREFWQRPGVERRRQALAYLARQAMLPLVSGLLVAVTFAAYAYYRWGLAGLPFWVWGEQAAIAGLLSAAVSGFVRWGVRRQRRLFFRTFGQQLADLRDKPSRLQTHSFVEFSRGTGAEELTAPLQTLVECYRQALTRVAEMQETLESLQDTSSASRPPETPRYPTFPFERSQQQMVGRLTSTGHWQTATPLLQQVLGRPIEQLNGKSFLRVVHATDRDRVARALAETLKDGESHNVVFRVRPVTPLPVTPLPRGERGNREGEPGRG
jgi:PAS domain-containing protein